MQKSNSATNIFFIIYIVFALLISGCQKESVFLEHFKPEVVINANDARLKAGTIHLFRDTVYLLKTNIVRNAGQVLHVDAGTIIEVDMQVSITINPGGVIEAIGTVNEPIVFTLAAYRGLKGGTTQEFNGAKILWNGIRIYGAANTSNDTGSGILSYVRIEFAGQSFNGDSKGAFYLNNVNAKTKISNIQVSYSELPAFDFEGGNVNASKLIAYASWQSDFKLHGGYHGKLQNLLAYRHPNFFFGGQIAGLEVRDPETFPIISNLTVLGPDGQPGFNSSGTVNAAFLATTDAKFQLANSVLTGFPQGGFYMDNLKTATSLHSGESAMTYSVAICKDPLKAFVFPLRTPEETKWFMLNPDFHNEQLLNISELKLDSPSNFDTGPNPSPKAESQLLKGANFSGLFTDAFFNKVAYRGAIGIGEDNWLQGWTNFIPLQTNYNY